MCSYTGFKTLQEDRIVSVSQTEDELNIFLSLSSVVSELSLDVIKMILMCPTFTDPSGRAAE